MCSYFCFCSPSEGDGSTKDSSFIPNEMLLSLFHGCLQHDLSDREVTLSGANHGAFMEQVLQRDRDGHPPPFMFPGIKGKKDTCPWALIYFILLVTSDRLVFHPGELPKTPVLSEQQEPTSTYHSVSTKDTDTSATIQQVPQSSELDIKGCR